MVPKDPPPHDLSFETMVLGDLAYVTGSFNAYVDMSRDYSTWFVESSARPIIGDVLMSGGRVLGGNVHAQVATRVEWRAHVEASEARVTEFEALLATKEAYMQEEIA